MSRIRGKTHMKPHGTGPERPIEFVCPLELREVSVVLCLFYYSETANRWAVKARNPVYPR
jgi:hypothetical protein